MGEIGRVEPDRRVETLEAACEFAAREPGMKRQLAVRRIDRPGHRRRRCVLCRGPQREGRQQRHDACAAARVHAYGRENGSMRRSTLSFSMKWW